MRTGKAVACAVRGLKLLHCIHHGAFAIWVNHCAGQMALSLCLPCYEALHSWMWLHFGKLFSMSWYDATSITVKIPETHFSCLAPVQVGHLECYLIETDLDMLFLILQVPIWSATLHESFCAPTWCSFTPKPCSTTRGSWRTL